MKRLTKAGNLKIHESCLVFCLPTSVCAVQCPGCYARKPEKRFPAVLASRLENLEATKQADFVPRMVSEIRKSKKTKFRIHESGDFYSQDYVNSWAEIIQQCPTVAFYTYTKTNFDFSGMPANFNLVSSISPIGFNFGDREYCERLVKEHGFKLCPCGIDNSVKCMRDCQLCATEKKVCFLRH